MRLIDAGAIDCVLDFGAVRETLERAFVAGFSGPARHHHALDKESGATQLLMPAWTSDLPGADSFLGTKIVSVFPQNRAHGIPAVNGTYVLQSGETGLPLAAIDGTRLTHWRTAAVSALGAKYLARADARTLLICGSGALAPMLIEAHSGVRPIEEILVWNHRRTGAETLVAALAAKSLNARVADDLAEAVARADIISCASLAREPFLRGEWLSAGTHVDLVGAFKLNMREADEVALQRARIFIDTERALSEGGEVALDLAGRAIARDHVQGTLADLITGKLTGRAKAQEITLFKSVGTSIADLAVAILVWQRIAASERSQS